MLPQRQQLDVRGLHAYVVIQPTTSSLNPSGEVSRVHIELCKYVVRPLRLGEMK